MFYPTAFSFMFLGINEFSLVLYPLLTSLGSIVLIYLFGKLWFNPKVGLLGAFFLSIFPLDIEYSTWLMPDVPIAFWCGLSIFLFCIGLKNKDKFNRCLLFLLSGLATGIAYLHKETGLISIFFIGFYMLIETIRNRRIEWSFLFVLLGLMLILNCEGLFYYTKNGDYFTRFHTVSDFYVAGRDGINRDFRYYPSIMFNIVYSGAFWWGNIYLNHFGFFYYFAALSFIYLIFSRQKNRFIPLLWFAVIFLYLQFGSMSLTNYLPMHRLERHLTIVTIPALLCLSCLLVNLWGGVKLRIIKRVFVALICLFLLASSIFYAYHLNEYLRASTWDIRQMVEFFKQHPGKTIYADVGVTSHLFFYGKFENQNFLRDITYVKNESELKGSYVVINGTRGAIEAGGGIITPRFTKRGWKLVAEISGPKIDIWAIYNPKIYYVE